MSDAAAQATAALTDSILGEMAQQGHVEAPVVEQPVAAPVEPASQPAPEPPAAAEEDDFIIDFQPKLSDDLRELLEEPDFEEEAALEVAAELEDEEGEYVDPAVAAKIKALEKRNAWLEQQNIQKSRKGWVDENLRAYPLLRQHAADEVKAIDASSRRAFAREAAKLNARYEKVLGPALERLKQEREAISAGAVEVARQEVAAAWGKPAADTLPPADVARQQALEKARKTGKLVNVLKELMS